MAKMETDMRSVVKKATLTVRMKHGNEMLWRAKVARLLIDFAGFVVGSKETIIEFEIKRPKNDQ